MKRAFLIMYVIGMNIVGLLLLPLIYLITIFTNIYSLHMVMITELWIKLLIEYRYVILQLTKSENGLGVEVMRIIDSTLEDLDEVICDIKEERELVQSV